MKHFHTAIMTALILSSWLAAVSPLAAMSSVSLQGPPKSAPAKPKAPNILSGVDTIVSRLTPSTADVDSFPDAAVNRRFRMRREAIATMQRELVAFAVAESTIRAATGSWEHQSRVSAKYFDWERFNREGNMYRDFGLTIPTDDPELDGWWFTIINLHTDFVCTIVVGKPEMVFPGAVDRQPFCRPDGVAGVFNQPAPYPRPIRLNTPPPMPWRLEVRCVGKGCDFERLAACTDIPLSRTRDSTTGPLFTWRKGEERLAFGEELQTLSPGMVVFRKAIAAAVRRDEAGVDTLHFTPADTVFPMAEADSYSVWWYHRKLWRGPRFWNQSAANRTASAVQVRQEKVFWPIAVSNTNRDFGYFEARPGLVSGMRPTQGDSLSRCADPVWITSTKRFAFYSDPWLNLHQFLYQWALVDLGRATSMDEFGVSERADKRLSESERRAWDSAVAFYRHVVAPLGELDSAMVRQKNALIALGGRFNAVPADLIPGISEILTAAMPVFRHLWWPAHNRLNRDFAQDHALWLRAHETQLAEIVERTFGVNWPTSIIRVDQSYYSNIRDGYSTDTLITVVTHTPRGYSLSNHEPLLRALLQTPPLASTPRAAISRVFHEGGVPEPDHLWDAIAFATADEGLRTIYALDRISLDSTRYWVSRAPFDSPQWKNVALAVREVWPQVVRGEISREEGYGALVKRLTTAGKR